MHSFSCSNGTSTTPFAGCCCCCPSAPDATLPIISSFRSVLFQSPLHIYCVYHTIICMGQRYTTMSLFCCLLSLLLFASVQGRALLEPQGEEGGGSVAAAMIGSRPPRCEGRCLSCGQCEAVQVPAIPQERTHAAATVSSRGGGDDDGGSIYKPLSWKCKCGGMILNP